MGNECLDNIYKSSLGLSHAAGLRAVFNAGYYAGAGKTITPDCPDVSHDAEEPEMNVVITIP